MLHIENPEDDPTVREGYRRMKMIRGLALSASLMLAAMFGGCFGKNDRQNLVETIMSNPDRLDSICRHTPLAQEYAREYLGHVQSRLDLVRELRNFNGYYEVDEVEAPFHDNPSAWGHHIRVFNRITGRSMEFQFHSPDGRNWRLNNLVIEDCLR